MSRTNQQQTGCVGSLLNVLTAALLSLALLLIVLFLLLLVWPAGRETAVNLASRVQRQWQGEAPTSTPLPTAASLAVLPTLTATPLQPTWTPLPPQATATARPTTTSRPTNTPSPVPTFPHAHANSHPHADAIQYPHRNAARSFTHGQRHALAVSVHQIEYQPVLSAKLCQ
ncbi:MAG: hypothetical protein IPH82_29325 [Chloroflexi bacterium]|nr:hypothetical protein [Chloroflexota bacterium]